MSKQFRWQGFTYSAISTEFVKVNSYSEIYTFKYI